MCVCHAKVTRARRQARPIIHAGVLLHLHHLENIVIVTAIGKNQAVIAGVAEEHGTTGNRTAAVLKS